MPRSTKHYHAMNGTSGCIPDNNEVHSSRQSAIDSLCFLFDSSRGLRTDLIKYGYHSFPDSRSAGADYAEVSLCHDPECLEYSEGG